MKDLLHREERNGREEKQVKNLAPFAVSAVRSELFQVSPGGIVKRRTAALAFCHIRFYLALAPVDCEL